MVACGEDAVTNNSSLCALDATNGHPVAKMAGTWTGSGTFQQTWNATTTAVEVKLTLEFDEEGVPKTLPALGFISPWRAYGGGGGPPASLREALDKGGQAYAYCALEADGSANRIAMEPVSRCGTDSAVEWRYQATYRFADLLNYNLYDYNRPEAPEVKVEATDSFLLATVGGVERLTVRARAAGATTADQRPLEMRFDAQLERGLQSYGNACELGRRVPQ
jgi:hypothetical protein